MLQLHMLRVAAVAQQICTHFQRPVDDKAVVAASLLHDMGNILKFDLERFPEFLQPKGLAYWQQVKQDCAKKYGPDEHQATLQIARELGVSERVLELIDAVGFNKAEQNWASTDSGIKICAYADMRVSPFGVVSLEERLRDLEDRYSAKHTSQADAQRRAYFGSKLREIETQIFSHCSLFPHQITDSTVNDTIEALKRFEIQ